MADITPEEYQYYQAHADDSRAGSFIGAVCSGYVISIVAIVLRIWARRRAKQEFGVDDYLAFAGALVVLGMMSNCISEMPLGLGRHIIFLQNPPLFMKLWVAGIVLYGFGICLIKVSILSFYNRLFRSKMLKNISIATAVVVIAYNSTLVLVDVLSCIPLSKTWEGGPGVCINTAPAYISLSAVNVATDVFILCLPIPQIWKLQMSISRKLQISGIFALGSLVCIFGLLRSVALAQVSGKDLTYEGIWGGVWSIVEISVGLLCACLPTYLPLIRKRYMNGANKTATVTTASSGATGRTIRNRALWTVATRGSKGDDDKVPFWQRQPTHSDVEMQDGVSRGSHDIQVTTRLEQSIQNAE